MTITSKYFVQTPTGDNLNLLDFSLSYGRGAITTAGETIQYNGSDAVDAFWVRPGLDYDLLGTGSGVDKIYFTGNLSDYTLTANAGDATLTLTRLSTHESAVISGGSTGNFDNLVFNDGFVNSNALYKAAKNGVALPALNTSETSQNPQGAAAPGAVLNDSIKAYAINQTGETFATTKPGVKLIISGAGGVDQVYVADGTNVDATDTGDGNDIIYLRGKWSDYTKTTDVSGNTITFTRVLGANTETIKVTGGALGSHDTVVFADGAVQTNDAFTTLKSNPNAATGQIVGLGFASSPTTPLISDSVIDAALTKLQTAAHTDTAAQTPALTDTDYKNTDAKNVVAANVAAYNSALDSAVIDAAQVKTTADVQQIVDTYNAIIASADGNATANTGTALTAAQFAAIGVIAAPASGNALSLLDNVVDVSAATAVDTVKELQAMSNAAKDVAAATGQGMSTTVTIADLAALGITGGITTANIAAIEAAIGAAAPGTLNTKAALQTLVDSAILPANLNAALAVLQTAASNNTAASLTAVDYAKAGLTGVTASNVAAFNSALNSTAVTGTQLATEAAAQGIVDAYNAILATADGTANTATPVLTAAQYAAIGVTGLGTATTPPATGTALYLLDSAVDKAANATAASEPQVQTMANAALDVMAAVGQPLSTTVSKADLEALGITGVTAANIAAVQAALTTATAAGVDTLAELQTLVTDATTPAILNTALLALQTAATNNTAATLTAVDYAKAGLSGVTSGNLDSLNSALNSAVVTGTQLGTTALAQGIVDAYNAILASADSAASTPAIALTGETYALIGVTGLQASGAPVDGSSLALLDSVIDVKAKVDVDTVAKVQLLADAAAHVMTAAGQTTGAVTLTGADLTALGITGLTASNTQAVINAIVAQTSDANVDTLAELQAIATTAQTKAATALSSIATAAHNNTAVSQSLAASVYIDAGVAGLTAANTTLLGAVNSALDSTAVDTAQVSTTAAVQNIVNDYSAILASADGTAGNTTTALTGNQYADVGVTGVSGAAAPVAGTNLFLMDSVVDAKSAAAVDTVAELQAIANAATDVMAAANQGTTNVTAAQLSALGITGDFSVQSTLDAINVAIHNAATTGVDTQGELQTLANAAAHPGLNSALNSVTNLDVTSNLVFTSTSAVKLGTTGFIHITQTGGTGYGGEAAAGNSQDIDISTAIGKGMISIDATGTKITINPTWDLDLGATYSISIDAGAFVSTAAGNQASAAVSGITFSTVTPGTHTAGNTTIATDAHASQMMDSSGALVAGKSWLDIGGLGDNTGGVSLLGSLQSGAYALVMKNYATTPADAAKGFNGIKAHDTNVSVTDFGADDLIYFDAQANNAAIQKFDPLYTNLINGFGHGGVAGQTAMELGLVTNPTQKGSSAQILMGFLNNTSNQIFASVYTSADGEDLGFGTFLGSQPVLMG